MQAWGDWGRGEPHFHLVGGAAGNGGTWERALSGACSVGGPTADHRPGLWRPSIGLGHPAANEGQVWDGKPLEWTGLSWCVGWNGHH